MSPPLNDKKIKFLKTTPLRNPRLATVLSFCIAFPLSLLIYSVLNALEITHVRVPIALPLGLTYIIYRQWIVYAKSIHSKEKSQ